ncbi:MAG TPA: aldehyde dehydrogenase family protein, partial [Solirubrobacterales bacterium]|nr:aldehyde dehydrogenase family protein [Solirubrobacterales bacterium]
CEAIDFLEYYAAGAVALDAGPELVQLPGERNALHYRPRGVVGVISPWNFPIAIATGMAAAGLATGNAVCLKPAEQSPGCALALSDALARAGLPPGVFSLLPGEGDVGAALVAHPGVHTIAFTGSGAVGLEILSRAAEPSPGQRHLKRVVAEMGGKNCMIIDADADLDDVVPAVLASAFGFAGQKCSATSRLLVHERIAELLTERLVGALDTLLFGQADNFGTDVPPLIEASSRERIERMLAVAGEEGARIHRVGNIPEGGGYFAAPALVTGAGLDAAVVAEEIFGPVVTIEPFAGIDAACDLVDAQAHALTGGLFSRNPRTIAAVARRTPVGNLYVNRGTTGAMVGRQPFGGNRLSGTGTKAGGPDYLLQFVEPVVVTENTVRHGLAP